MKRRDLEKRLKDRGYEFEKHGGEHDIFSNGFRRIAVPRKAEINEYTAKAILKQAKEDR